MSSELREKLVGHGSNASHQRNSSPILPPRPGTDRQRQRDVFHDRYGYSWDLCMVFPSECPDGCPPAKDVIKKLTLSGLETYCYFSVQRDEIICKIRAPLERLARYAADVDYTLLLDEVKVKRVVENGSKEPLIAGRHITHDPTITMYRPHELIYGKFGTSPRLANMYAAPPYLEHPFSSVHRIKLMRRMIESPIADGCGMNLADMSKEGTLKAFFPFHDEERRRSLFSTWVKRCVNPGKQPLDQIKDYLGEKIAMYFALLGHYTSWLGPLSIAGVIMCIDQIVEWNLDALLAPYFSIFVSLWAVLMLEYWKRQESRLAMRWGMSDFEEGECDRPQFKGDTMVSFVDGSPMTYYPPEEYVHLMVIANIIVVAMLALVVGMITGIFVLEWEWGDSDDWVLSTLGSYICSFLLSVEIQVMNFVYKKVAIWTTERENHRTDTMFEDVLILKLAVFQFVNSYASLFYIAFVSPFTSTGCSYSSCLDSLCQSLGIIFCTRLFVANTLEIWLPRWKAKRKAKKEREGVPDDTLFSEAEVLYTWDTYHEMMDPLGDMSEIFIQYGYVTLFVVSFPLAPVLAYVSNYIEIRIDATKIMYEHRRPFPRGAQDIGTWQAMWTATAAIAVVTNAALIFFTSEELDWSSENLVWGFLIWQYCVFGIMGLFAVFVPDVPEDVSIQLKRQKFITSKVIDQVPDEKLSTRALPVVGHSEGIEIKPGDDKPPPRPFKLPKFKWC